METTFRSDERFTQAEFSRWLDKHGGMLTGTVELIEGAIVMAPPAHYPHSSLVTRLVTAIENHVRPRALGEVHAPSAGYEFRSHHHRRALRQYRLTKRRASEERGQDF